MAEQMIKESLPIKCLEAVVLSLYLTSPLASLQRFTIRFKSRYKSRWYRHVVLGLNHSGLYGALGLSRRSTLMYKPLQYQSLYDLVQDFLSAYEDCKEFNKCVLSFISNFLLLYSWLFMIYHASLCIIVYFVHISAIYSNTESYYTFYTF
jgi:hypothetical protein